MNRNAGDLIRKLLEERGSLLQSDIPKLSGISKSRTSEILRKLEREGYIKREKVIGKNVKVSLLNRKVLKIGIIRAAEYPFVVPFMERLRSEGYIPLLEVFENGVEATKALALGKVDLAFSPLITQLVFSSMSDIEIIGAGAKGGGALVGEQGELVGTTVLSSMDLWVHMSSTRSKVTPFDSAESLVKSLKLREVDRIAIWEPYVTRLRMEGYKVEEFDHLHCCTLASRLEEGEKFKRIYQDAFQLFLAHKERWGEIYAGLIGEDPKVLLSSLANYEFDWRLDEGYVKKVVTNLGFTLKPKITY